MSMHSFRRLRSATAVFFFLFLFFLQSQAQRSYQDPLPYSAFRWTSVFGASPSIPYNGSGSIAFADYTFRQVAHVSMGTQYGLRLRLSNALGSTPITLADVHVGRWAGSATNPSSAIVAGSDIAITFGQGQSSVAIPAGGEVISDPVAIILPPQADLVVSIYVPAGNTATFTQHGLAVSNVYFVQGDVSGNTTLPGALSYNSRPFLTSIEVAAAASTASIVTLGDSITDGFGSSVDHNTRWPDDLAVRLQAKYGSMHGVVNAGISGNGLISDLAGPNAISRLNRDVITVPGVKYLVLLESINDIASASPKPTAAQLIAGYRAILARAHEQNIYVYGATITPIGGSVPYNATNEALRQAVNAFIRTSGAFDAVIDFDKAIADPNTPTQILAAYNSGDSVHPNDAGYQAMANAIDLSLFDPNTH